MEQLLMKLAAESPSLVVMIVLVVIFLRALRVLITSNRETLKDRDETIKEIASDFADASRDHTKEMKKLGETIGAHSEVIRKCQANAGRGGGI